MKNILLFGAGKSATVLIDYLVEETRRHDWRLTVADSNAETVRAKLGARSALLLAICGFAGHHGAVLIISLGWLEGLLLLIPIVFVGAGWVTLRQRTGGLSAPSASHIGADLALALLYALWLRR